MKLLQKSTSSGASFLPDDYVARKGEMRANFLSLALFGVVMFVVVAAFFVTNRQWTAVRNEQEAINVLYQQEAEKIEQLKSLESQKDEMMEKAEITTALIEKVPRSILLAQLITRMPKEITVLELELKSKRIEQKLPTNQPKPKPTIKVRTLSGNTNTAAEEKPKIQAPKFEYTLTIIGVCAGNNPITDYQRALGECELLDRVELEYIQETTIREMKLRKFSIRAGIRSDADARTIEPVATLRKGVSNGLSSVDDSEGGN